MAFTHVVTFKWRDVAFDARPIAEALSKIVPKLAGLQNYLYGSDVGLDATSYDFAVVAVFDSREDFFAYRDHPDHRRVITELIIPAMEDRTVVQIETDPVSD